MAGWLTFEEAEAQVLAASEKYDNAQYDGEAILYDRFIDMNDNYSGNETSISDNDMTALNSTSAYNSNGDYIGEVYSGGCAIVGQNGYTTTNFHDACVDAINDGDIYSKGGHIPGAGIGFDTNGYTAYTDSLVLAEASKITGVKWF